MANPRAQSIRASKASTKENKKQVLTIKHNGYKFLIRDRDGKIYVRVSCKSPHFEHEITTDCATVDAAAEKAELNRCLNEALKLQVAAQAQSKSGDEAEAPAPPPPTGSLASVLDEMFMQISANRWADSTAEGFGSIVEFIKTTLPQEVLCGPKEKVTYDQYKVLGLAINNHPTIKDSKYQTKQNFGRVTRELIKRGLPRECEEVVSLIEAKSPHAKRGKPNSGEDILTMLDALEGKPFPVRFLFWNGFSGGPQAGDAGSIMRKEIALNGKVGFGRMKTQGKAEYVLLDEGLQTITTHAFGPYDIFVLQELLQPGPPFSIKEIVNVSGLVHRWMNPVDPVSEFLSGKLSHNDRLELAAYDPKSRHNEKRVLRVLTKILNRALRGNELQQVELRLGLRLRPETAERLQQPLPESDPAGLNRMLLDDAYPSELMRYPNDVTSAQLADKAGKVWREFLKPLGISGKSFKSFRQLITTDSLSRAVRDALVARMQGNGLTAVRKYDFAEDWQFFVARDLRQQLLQAIRTGNYEQFVLTYEDLVDKLKAFIAGYIEMAEDLAMRRHKDLTLNIEAASTTASNEVRQAISRQDESDGQAHALLMEKADLVLHRTELLKNNLDALADQLFGKDHADEVLLSALHHHLGRDLTPDEIAAVQRGEFPASLQLGKLPDAA